MLMSKNNGFDDARPVARTEAMIVEELEGDLIIYDTASNKAHALNPLAARIWKHCDGERTVSDLTALFAAETPADAVANCLSQLERLRLLNAGSLGSADVGVLSRRQLLRKVAIGAAATAVMVPIVTSILAPSAMATASCQALNATCSGGKPCCPPLVCSATTGKCINPPT
jgi:hypothetical protein